MPASPLPKASAALGNSGVVWIVADGKRPGDRNAWVSLDALVVRTRGEEVVFRSIDKTALLQPVAFVAQSCLFSGADVASHVHRVEKAPGVEAVGVDPVLPPRKKPRPSSALGTGLLSELLAANDAAVVSDSETESEENPLLCSPLGLIESAARAAPTNGGDVAEATSSEDEGQVEPLGTPTAVADAASPKLSSLKGWREVVRDLPSASVGKKTPEKSSGTADGDGGYDVVATVVEEALLVAPARSSRRLRFGESATPSQGAGGVDYKRFRRKQAA
ncbi:hypothetical protein H632_c1981p0 [Helicosporidium sp. ATCC 50920]|nr:hypothetical protein H632_c1981p0 [Helicosporidium sp. ATCC 50920]|eukprot:KDD73631.1 hypothetical protein H632_c1981p0 [Helicosporidium sp. ATCC 50920]